MGVCGLRFRPNAVLGLLVALGRHTLKAYTRKQKVIAKSSAEAELYAAALGASEAKGVVSLLRDLWYEKNPVLTIDAKATEHNLHRQGIGKLRHIGVAYLWYRTRSDPRGCECAESGVKKT